MYTLTAIIHAHKGSEALVHAELLKVGAYAREYEPDTIGYFVPHHQVKATCGDAA